MAEKEEYTVDELSVNKKELEAANKELERMSLAIEELRKRRHKYIVPIRNKGNSIKFAVITDLHIGSLYARPDMLNAFFDLCRRERVRTVLNAGDVLDGNRIYRGQEFELEHVGADAQIAAAVKDIDSHGLNVTFITGNHDESFWKQSGFRVGSALKEKLGWQYLGPEFADLFLETRDGHKFKILLVHPGGTGTAYALSYRLQKMIEALPGGSKPQMLITGHYHKAEHIPQYRNVSGIQGGSFQSQTPFMRNKSIASNLGGWIIEVVMGELVNRIKAEFVSFFEEGESA